MLFYKYEDFFYISGTAESMKHVYIFTTTATSKHPLQLSNTTYDASLKKTIIYDMVAVEDFDDPQRVSFACLEAEYTVSIK